MACCDLFQHHTKQKQLCSGYFIFGMFCSLAPIVLGAYMLINGGVKWGGNLPENVKLMYALLIASGALALICTARVIYQLLFNRHYDGRKGSIRSQILLAICYLAAGVFGYLSLSNYADSPACSNRNLLDLWEETVFNEGTQAYRHFCHTCQCLISTKDLSDYRPLLLHSLNYSTKQGATSIAECDAKEGQLNTSSFEKLQAMEENFACAGFCEPNPTFTFIGTLNGKPTSQNGCLAEVSSDFNSYRIAIIVLTSLLSAYSIGGFFVGMQLRQAKLREGMEKCGIESFHTRMISANSAMGGHDDLKIEDFHSTSDFGGAYLVENNVKLDYSDNQRQVSANFKEIESERDLQKYKRLEKMKQAFRSMNTPRGTFRIK